MHRLMVTAVKAVLSSYHIQEFLLVCEEEFQKTVSLNHSISYLDYKCCLPLISEISRIPGVQPFCPCSIIGVVKVTAVWKQAHMEKLHGVVTP